MKKLPVKQLKVNQHTIEGKYNLSDFPNFSVTGVLSYWRKVYGQNALLVRCGKFIYNVETQPEIYEMFAK